jgi:hypothetical protein
VPDAAAKIAAERDATAEALENLTRLLRQNPPDLPPAVSVYARPSEHMPPRRPRIDSLRLGPQAEPPPLATGASAPMLPLPVPPERRDGRGVYALGFLAGLGLSLMTGLVLYLVINTG